MFFPCEEIFPMMLKYLSLDCDPWQHLKNFIMGHFYCINGSKALLFCLCVLVTIPFWLCSIYYLLMMTMAFDLQVIWFWQKIQLFITIALWDLGIWFLCVCSLWLHFAYTKFLCPLLEKEGHIALHMSVGMSVCMSVCITVYLNLVQLITQECFAQEASNLIGR